MVWFILEEEEPKAEVINSNAEEQMGLLQDKVVGQAWE